MELGGEFYLDLHTLSEKNHSVDAYLSGEQPLYFDSGRSALRFAARSLRPGTILLPEYIHSTTDSLKLRTCIITDFIFCRNTSAIPSSPPFPATRCAFTD